MNPTEAEIRINSASLIDVPVLAGLHAVCFEGNEDWDETAMAQILAMPGAFGLIGLLEEAPVGFALCRVAGDECEILSLGVTPDVRCRGFGGLLVRALTSQATEAGARCLFLEVAEDNQAALALYAGEGFSQAGHRRSYYRRPAGQWIDALVLTCELPDAVDRTSGTFA